MNAGIVVVAVIPAAVAGTDGSISVTVGVKSQTVINYAVAVVVKAVTNLRVARKVVRITRDTLGR